MSTPFEQAARIAIASRLAAFTRQDYGHVLDRWLVFCAEAGFDPVSLPGGAAAAFRDAVAKGWGRTDKKKKRESSSVRNHLAALSFIYGWLAAQKEPLVRHNPFSSKVVPWPPAANEGLTEALTDEEVQRIFEACATNKTKRPVSSELVKRDTAILWLLYATGMRRMSILSLRRDRLFQDEDQIVARIKVKGSGDAALDRVTLPEEVVVAVQTWLEVAPKGEYVFPSRNGKGSMDLSMINKVLSRWAKAAAVKHAHPHRFRAAFITSAYDAGLNQMDIQKAVHHADPRSTQKYDRGLRGAGVAAAVAKFRDKKP